MDAQTCILTRRSVRKFTGEKVSRQEIEKIVSLAAYAPSWKNTQISRYIAIEDEGTRAEIVEKFCFPGSNNPAIILSCPVLIAQTFQKNRCGYQRDGSFSTSKGSFWQSYDAGIATQTFCLAAWDKGIGSVIMGIFDEAKAASLLNLPEDRILAALIPVGYPDEEPAAPRRKPVDDLLSFIS